ncbi:hypothetical protein [Variovorax boronicumulans]
MGDAAGWARPHNGDNAVSSKVARRDDMNERMIFFLGDFLELLTARALS